MAIAALTRLQLVKALGRWAGQIEPEEITTTVAQTGHIGNLVEYISQAWLDIQLAQHTRWLWMRNRSVNTVALTPSTRTLAASAIHADCRVVKPFLLRDISPDRYILLKHPTSSAIARCGYVPYTHWRGEYDRGTRPEQLPVRFTIRPDGTLEFDPTPDVAYTLDCDYLKVPTELTLDASTPNMPTHFHMLVMWWAIVHLMDYDRDGGRGQGADRQYQKMYNRLLIEQLEEDMHDEYLTTSEPYIG